MNYVAFMNLPICPYSVYELLLFSQCRTQGCDGSGHVTGKFPTHYTVSGCPVAPSNQAKLMKRLSVDTSQKREGKRKGSALQSTRVKSARRASKAESSSPDASSAEFKSPPIRAPINRNNSASSSTFKMPPPPDKRSKLSD